MSEKYQYFTGIKFTKDEETGYYLNSTLRRRMHRYAWEFYHGAIPKFYQVHHIDGNRANNSIENLKAVKIGEHQRLHGEKLSEMEKQMRRDNLMENAIPAAVEWHKSEAGKAWHKKHYAEMKDAFHIPCSFICENCGASFVSSQIKSRFCSNKCKSAWRRKSGADTVTRKCRACGNDFQTNRYKNTVTCSRKCANALLLRSSKMCTKTQRVSLE